jgi:hypothetical protein
MTFLVRGCRVAVRFSCTFRSARKLKVKSAQLDNTTVDVEQASGSTGFTVTDPASCHVRVRRSMPCKRAPGLSANSPGSSCSYSSGKLAQNILRLFPNVDRGHIAARTKDHAED